MEKKNQSVGITLPETKRFKIKFIKKKRKNPNLRKCPGKKQPIEVINLTDSEEKDSQGINGLLEEKEQPNANSSERVEYLYLSDDSSK